MAENTAQTNPSPEEPLDPNTPQPGSPEDGGAQKGKGSRKKRRWPYMVGGVILFLLLVLVFAPTLLSIGPARAMVLGVVNDSLNGRVEVADWSLGWNSGITVNGLKVYEDKDGKNLILQASRARTELSLLKALKSGFTEIALGRTDVDNLDLTNLHVDEQGVPNIAKLPKASKKDPNKKSEPIHLSGDVHVNNLTGHVSAAGVAQKLRINPSDLSVTITGLNDPIENDIKLAFVVEDPTNRGPQATPGTITLKGKADLFDQDKFDLAKAQVDEKLNLSDVNLAALNPILAMRKMELELGGIASGAVDVGLKGASTAAATGEIKVANFQATGKALKEDVFRSNLTVPIKVVRTVDANNVAALKVEDLRVQTDYGYVAVSADATQESLERLAKKLPPGREGHLSITADFEKAAKLLESLRNTLDLEADVKFDSAKVYAQVEGWLFADRVVSKTQFNLSDVAATNKGKRVTLEPVTATVDVTYAPVGGGQAFNLNQLRDVGLAMASGFATINGATGKGGTLAKFDLKGSGDFGKLRQQLAQFSDLKQLQIQGTWNLAAATNGDPSKEDAVVNTNVRFTANNLVLAGVGKLAPIRQPWLDVTAAGNVNLKGSKPDSITGAAVVLKSNNAENPTVDLRATGDVDLNTYASKRFDVTVKAALAKARDEFAAVVPALNYLESGQLGASVSGSYDGKSLTLLTEKPLAVKVTGLSVRQAEGAKTVAVRDQSLDVILAGVISMAGDDLGADVKTLSVSAPKLLDVKKNEGELKVMVRQGAGKKQVTGNGGVTIFADAKRLSDMAKSFAPPATQPSGPDSNVGELTRALVNGTLAFRRAAEPVTTVDGNFTADVGVTTAKEPINDKIALTLTAAAPDDLTQPLKAGLSVKSNTVNAAVSDAVVVLARQLADKTTAFNGPFELVRSAKVSVTAERLEMLQAMADSFSPVANATPKAPAAAAAVTPERAPPRLTGDERISSERGARRAADPEAEETVGTEPPLPPLRVLSGRMVLNANVAREGQTTALKDTTLDVSNLSFRRGDGFYEAKDRRINLKLAAAVETADGAATAGGAGAIKRVQVQELAGDLGVGQIKLAKPIAISNLAAAIPTVDGGIQLTGALGEALRMVEAFQGAPAGTKYPYAGDYDLTQSITTDGDTVRLAGTIKATKFRAFDPNRRGEVTFSEDLLTVTNDVSADSKTDTATIRNLLVNMESTGALRLAVSDGQLADWGNQRKIAKEITAKLRVDWPKLWTIVRPMLDPETQESLKDLQLAGAMEKTFTVTGSFPATGMSKRGEVVSLSTARALKSLSAYGGVAFDRVSVNGIDVRNLDLPVSLEAGVLYVQDATKPKGQRYPKAFACNDGEIDLGGVQVDLTHTGSDGSIVPWFTIPDANKVVLRNVALNPLMADSTVGNYVNPGFAGPQDARGRVTLTSTECKDVPLDWFTAAKKQTTPGGPEAPARRVRQASRSDGRAEFLLAISEMELQAPLLPLLLKQDQISGEVKKGHIVIENGIVKSDIPIVDAKGRTLMAWNGSVNLQDRRILNFNTGIAKELLNDLPILRNNQKALPAILNVPISGSFDKPKVDLVAAVTSSIIPGFGSGKPEDIIKGLPDILGGNKKEKDKGREADPRDRRSSADDGRDTSGQRDAAGRGQPQSQDPVGGLLDLAGGLLNKEKSGGKDRSNMRDDRGTDRVSGNDRISAEPRTGEAAGERRVSGDEPIGSARGAAPAATTRSTTAPAERNVSGRTKAQRNRDGQ